MRNYRNRPAAKPSRWMELRYAGTCKVCGEEISAGSTAFWDGPAGTITCHRIECCEADGLTESKWVGSPVSGKFVPSRTAKRIGASHA